MITDLFPILVLITMHFGHEAAPRALDIAWCESNWTADAQNKTSSAAGVFQFIDSTWKWVYESGGIDVPFEEGRYDAAKNIEAAAWLYRHGGGWKHWNESRSCWR